MKLFHLHPHRSVVVLLTFCSLLFAVSVACAQLTDDDEPPAISSVELKGVAVATLPPKSNATKIAPSLPGPPRFAAIGSPKIAAMVAKNKKYPTTAGWRALGEAYLKIGRRDKAAEAMRAEAALHSRRGKGDAAIIMGQRAAQHETDIRLYLDRPANEKELKVLNTQAVLEPAIGTYLGAFIDYADRLPRTWKDENWRTHRNFEDWNALVGKPHATYFMYMGYGSQFPFQWLQKCKQAGAIAHLALEPHDIEEVKNDQYLEQLARDCGRMQWPIFLRYGSEMNGKWTKWNGKPTLYKEKWKIVRNAFKKHAPLVAMVWCPNAVPVSNIMEYYPGDAFVDWVGINVYSVPYFDGDPRNSAENTTPLELIDPIYKAFAHKKPIAICEYGASQMATDKLHRPDFAIRKMSLFYSALPRLYPRIKMISWFDMNTLKHAQPGRQLNNYSITEADQILHAYRGVTDSPYFIEAGNIRGQMSENATRAFPRAVSAGQIVPSGNGRFSIWVKSYTWRPKVYLKIGKKIVYGGQNMGAHVFDINTKAVPAGPQPVTVYVFDEKNRYVASKTTTLVFGKTRGNEPMPVTGRVLHYYADDTGLVRAFQLETPGGTELVYFPPNMASELLLEHPEGVEIAAWVKAGDRPGAKNLVGLGQEKPESWLPPEASSTLDEEDVLRLPAPRKASENLWLLQSADVDAAQKLGLRLYAPLVPRERGGEDVPVESLFKESTRPW